MLYLHSILLNTQYGLPAEGSYLYDLPLMKQLLAGGSVPFRKPVTFLAGENGSGKSTLLEALAVLMGFNPEGGSRDFQFSTRDSHSELYRYLTPVRGKAYPADGFFLRAESFYNTATYLDENSDLRRYGGRSFHEQSHGEAFLALVDHRFTGCGLYLMDEPEAALSPQRLLSLLVAIHDLAERESQLIIATHSPILMAYPGAEILWFGEDGVRPVAYKDTEHYRITRDFLNAPERILKYLLEE